MAQVDLRKVYLHDSADNDDYLALFWIDEEEMYTAPGEVRRYAGGRYRHVRKIGAQQVVPITFPDVAPSDLTDLKARAGKLQMLRDSRGRKTWGVFHDVQVKERQRDVNVIASILFEEVTYVEAV